jgi:Carboxypeptidase regulatory-like domain
MHLALWEIIVSIFSFFRFATGVAAALVFSLSIYGQSVQTTVPRLGNLVGTVTDVNGDPVPGATVVLQSAESDTHRTLVTPDNGFFEFHDVQPGTPYQINITAKDFADWTSPTITLEPGQFKIVAGIQLRIRTEVSSVQVTYDRVEVAAEQFKAEEKQRVFGIIPNFYVSYDQNAEPLTAKMKFKLALKVSYDPVTVGGVFLVASSRQAANSPNYGQGWRPYGERVGAIAADGFSDIMIGGAILPSLLHQDPRYFYQGTGTTGSRIRHAMFSPFVARGDNGKWMPNYSSVGGDLASSALSNLYYPKSNRGAGLVFGNFAIGTAERIGASLAQEFLLGKFTRRGGHVK